MKKFSVTDVARMRKLYNSGVMIKTIAETFDCHPTTVGYHVNSTTKNRKQGEYIRNRISNMTGADAYNFVTSYMYNL